MFLDTLKIKSIQFTGSKILTLLIKNLIMLEPNGDTMYASPGTSEAGGVAILLNNNFEYSTSAV